MKCNAFFAHCLLVMVLLTSQHLLADKPFPLNAKRIVFMGDSITHAGHYVSLLEIYSRQIGDGHVPEMINLGLPSETCSALSEPDHPFPRPDVHERIGRMLSKLKPDVVFACYGMNDGIYYPFSQERFEKYKDGINRIIEKVHASGAKLILMTPPPFDPLPLKLKGKLLPAGAEKYAWFSIYEDYDKEVIGPYGAWILEQSDRVERVIDLRSDVLEFTAKRRQEDPKFTMSPDGVHLDQRGHRVLAEAIAKQLDIPIPSNISKEILSLAEKRQHLLHMAWLSEVGHKRPGVKPGEPIDKALEESGRLEETLAALIRRSRKGENK